MDKETEIQVLEYAANHIDSNNRRGVFVKAFVEGEEWAVTDFENWRTRQPQLPHP